MEEITTTTEEITEEVLGRLVVVEQLVGAECVVNITRSELVLSDPGQASFRISVDHEEGDKLAPELPELLKASPWMEFMARSGVSSCHIRATIIMPSDEYVIPVPFVILTGLILKKKEEGAAMVPLFRLHTYSKMMGMQDLPISQLPLGFVVAIISKDEEELSAMKERLRAVPSRFGSSSHAPEYRAVLVDPQTKEEGNLQWRI